MIDRAASQRLGRMLAFAAALTVFGNASAQVYDDIPFVATPQENVERMLQMAQPGPNDFLIDLGSGDGRFVITAAKRYGTRGLGVEIDGWLLEISNKAAREAGVAHLVEFRNEDLFETDISKATVITMYLLESVIMSLRPRLLKELRPGSRVVSHHYALGAWKPDQKQHAPGQRYPVFLWIVPADAAGTWEMTVPLDRNRERTYRVTLAQSFQELSGHADAGGLRLMVNEPRLSGERIEFQVTDDLDYGRVTWRVTGRVSGDVIEGTVKASPVNSLHFPLPEVEAPVRAVRVRRPAGG